MITCILSCRHVWPNTLAAVPCACPCCCKYHSASTAVIRSNHKSLGSNGSLHMWPQPQPLTRTETVQIETQRYDCWIRSSELSLDGQCRRQHWTLWTFGRVGMPMLPGGGSARAPSWACQSAQRSSWAWQLELWPTLCEQPSLHSELHVSRVRKRCVRSWNSAGFANLRSSDC